MKIYRLDFDVNNYKSIHLCEDVSADYYQMFNGERVGEEWTIPRVTEYEEDKELIEGDAPGFNIPVFNKKALDAMLPIIKNNIEVLPLKYKEDYLYGINVLTMVDAIDYSLSEYKTFRDGKRIMLFKKIVFIDNGIKDINIFKLSVLRLGEVYVSDKFRDNVINSDLKGFKMNLVYESNEKI